MAFAECFDSDFRTLKVGQDRDFLADTRGHATNLLGAFQLFAVTAMRHVDAQHVSTRPYHGLEGFFRVSGRTQGGNDLCSANLHGVGLFLLVFG